MPQEPLFVHHQSPGLPEVKAYFLAKGAPEKEAEDFFLVYEYRHWTSRKGKFLRNWRSVAFRWICSLLPRPTKPCSTQVI